MKLYEEYSMFAPAGGSVWLCLWRRGVLDHLSVNPRRRRKDARLELVLDGVQVVFSLAMTGHLCVDLGIDLGAVAEAKLYLSNSSRWDTCVDLVATIDEPPTRGE
jgi:hypothetical protein